MSKSDLDNLGLNMNPGSPDVLSSLDGLESLPPAPPAFPEPGLPEPPPLPLSELPPVAPALAEAPVESKKEKKRKAKEAKQRAPRQPGDSLVERVKQAGPYQVLLAVSAAMIFIAIVCMVIELGSYGFALRP